MQTHPEEHPVKVDPGHGVVLQAEGHGGLLASAQAGGTLRPASPLKEQVLLILIPDFWPPDCQRINF